jgi:hypothetical protein
MQYLASLPLTQDLEAAPHGSSALLLFQCQQQPGMCEEWAPDSGGNAALITDIKNAEPIAPPSGPTFLPTRNALNFLPYEEPVDADEASEQYEDIRSAPQSLVAGKAGGQPAWIQYDETPTCRCGAVMSFVAQLDERAASGLNFGGGSAYAFICKHCRLSAKLLWQC